MPSLMLAIFILKKPKLNTNCFINTKIVNFDKTIKMTVLSLV